jgi:hypothetical protein
MDEATAACERGESASLRLKTKEALDAFEESLALFGRGATTPGDFAAFARCSLSYGAALETANKDKEAIAAFQQVLTLSNAVKPNKRTHRADTVALFQRAEREMHRVKRGAVNVTSTPPGAAVLWNGKRVGITPLSLNDLVAGTYWLSVTLDGYRRFLAPVVVAPGTLFRSEAFLQRQVANTSHLDLLGDSATELRSTTSTELIEKGYSEFAVINSQGTRALAWRGRDASFSPLLSAANPGALGKVISEFWAGKGAGEKPPAVAPVAVVHAEPAPSERTNLVLSLLPFGVGQFVERRHLAGAIFLVVEVALLVANIALAAAVISDKRPDGNYDNFLRSRIFQGFSIGCFFGVFATMGVGAIDGALHR